MNDWILVRLDPLETHEGSILLPHGQVLRRATVLAVGPGRVLPSGVRAPMDLAPNEVVVFRREHLEHQQGKQVGALLQELGANLGLLRVMDVLYAEVP